VCAPGAARCATARLSTITTSPSRHLCEYRTDGESSRSQMQGLTLVHFSAQLKRILRDRGAIRGCSGGV
jgi:hypothetical protein